MSTPPSGNPVVPFGKYRLLRKLAKGGMAELFLAADPAGKPIVIKRVLPHFTSDAEFLQMFLDEARLAAQLNHPSIVRVEDLGQEREHLFLAMEYIDGIDLERVVKLTGGTLPAHIAARVGTHVCNALYYANNFTDLSGKPLGIIHRDVTPGNIMITRRGAVKLVDFGIAKVATLERTRPGIVKGKFRYMSPEQVRQKQIDGRSDLFSLGTVLYELTTGHKPFDGAQVIDIVRALVSHEPPPPEQVVPGFPRSLSQAIMRALEKDLSRRYPDGREMQRGLEDALTRLPPSGPREMAEFIAPFLKPSPFPTDLPPTTSREMPARRETRTPMPAVIGEPTTSPERAVPARPAAAALENEQTSPRASAQADKRTRTASGSVRKVTLPPRPAFAEPPTIDESANDEDKTTVDLQRPSYSAPVRPPPFDPNESLPPTDVRRPPPPDPRASRPPPAPAARNRSMEMMVIDEQVLQKAPPEMAREMLADEATRTIGTEFASTMRDNASLVRAYKRRRAAKVLVVVGFLVLSGLAAASGWLLHELRGAATPPAQAAPAPAAPAAREGLLVLEGPAGTAVEIDGKPGCTVPCTLRLPEGQHTCAGASGKSRFKTVVNVPAGGTVRLPIPK